MIASLYLSTLCNVAGGFMCLYLRVPWVGLQCVILAFPDHTHFFVMHLDANNRLFYPFDILACFNCYICSCASVHTLSYIYTAYKNFQKA